MQDGLKRLEEVHGTAQVTALPPLKQASRTFDGLLVESVDTALSDLLGERTRNLIYDYLAAHYGYGREEIPQKIDEFYSFLQNTFSSGGKTVGRTIIRRLFDKLGYEYVNVPGFEFFDYLEAAKARVGRDEVGRERAANATVRP